MKKCKIIFYPWKKEVSVQSGTDLLDAAVSAGVHIYNNCGGEGVCGRCRVIVRKGRFVTDSGGRLSEEEKKKGYVLACRTVCEEDLEVEVPPESRMEEVEILKDFYTPSEEVEKEEEPLQEIVFPHSPLSTKFYLELPPPTLEDNLSDLERLYRGIREKGSFPILQTGLANIKKISKLLRDSSWKITVTIGNRNGAYEVVLVEPGNTADRNYGVALDIGTSTLVAYLIDLNEKKVLGAKASYNPQIDFGEDVISRIIFAQERDGLEKLHSAVTDTINELINELVTENRLSLNSVQCVTCAGNTTMMHLLLSIPPEYIRKEPYIPTANFLPVMRAAEAGININPRGLLSCISGVASYVGGDIVAGVLASGMSDFSTLSLFIDLGTNGEVVLGNREWLVACSTSAGPCFEGGGIKFGIRAMQGAIQKIEISEGGKKVVCHTIGNAKPKGICGAGLIQAAGEMLLKGIMDRAGKIKPAGSPLVRKTDEGMEFILAPAAATAIKKDIVITEADIKNLINSKGAVYSGAEVLLKRTGLRFDNLDRVFISGGLGTALAVEESIMIGLLPDLPGEKFIFTGNSAITGARMCLLSQDAMKKSEIIAGRMTCVELSVAQEFMANYTASLFFPHTDIDLFPTVKEKLKKD